MVVGYTEKDRIFHLPFAVDWIELDWKLGWICSEIELENGLVNAHFPNYLILLNACLSTIIYKDMIYRDLLTLYFP